MYGNNELDSISPPPPETWGFMEELKKEEKRTFHFTRSKVRRGEADLSGGVRLRRDFPDPDQCLDSIFRDWESLFPPGNGKYAIHLKQEDCGPFDSFRIQVQAAECVISAGNAEGIRRALYYLEDLLLAADGPFLPLGTIHRRAWLENRISRCFFGPVKRPPRNRDELADRTDYYPDAYLNRLAREGINGLWLTVDFASLIRGDDRDSRFAKLKRTVDKCLRYGIRTWLFMIEPIAQAPDSAFFKEYPELAGAMTFAGRLCVCPSTEAGQRYLYECTREIFRRVPRLGGIINISLGERDTTCLSASGIYGEHPCSCPRCAGKKPEEILFRSVDAMNRGMKSAAPSAQFISWLYLSFAAPESPFLAKLSACVPEGVTLLCNFDSGVRAKQQGKLRIGGDYWLSRSEAAGRFVHYAQTLDSKARLGAKIQVGCSHECATLPYLPVPGLLYRKYRKMRELKVSTVLQCWYFGNYPGLMNRAAGMLAFEDFSDGEEAFLRRLAAPEWGRDASCIARFWRRAGRAYSHYPLSNAMQYYGPFHDGIVWLLYPYRQHLPLAPTWQTCHPGSGDNISDALGSFTLPEAAAQAGLLDSGWRSALKLLDPLRSRYAEDPDRRKELSLYDAAGLLFRSGANILRFYALRAENRGFTPVMREIMREEAENSLKMELLCRNDSRLGFHSEAENYKFFPEKLLARVRILREFQIRPPESQKEKILKAFTGRFRHGPTFSWRLGKSPGFLKVEVRLHGKWHFDQLFAALAGTQDEPAATFEMNGNGTFFANRRGIRHEVTSGDNTWQVVFLVPDTLIPTGDVFRIAFTRFRGDAAGNIAYDGAPPRPDTVYFRLLHGPHNPRYMFTCRWR